MALPPASRQREIQQIEDIYSAAITALGAKSIAESLDLWRDVPTSPNQALSATSRWLDQLLKVLRLRRDHARRLTIPYYRLTRALWTGYTIQDPEDDQNTSSVALDDLRSDFYKQVEALTPNAIQSRPRASEGPQDGSIKVEQIKQLRSILDDIEKVLDQIAVTDLRSSGSTAYAKQIKLVDTEQPGTKVDQQRNDIHSQTGIKTASITERSTLDGARSLVHGISANDKRVYGYVRVSETGTPCGWCAMLISRGLVLYKSKHSAEYAADGGKYHTNCHCRAVLVYSEEQYDSNPQFDLNRRYSKLWPSVTSGLGGKQAVAKWRKYFRDHPNEVY